MRVSFPRSSKRLEIPGAELLLEEESPVEVLKKLVLVELEGCGRLMAAGFALTGALEIGAAVGVSVPNTALNSDLEKRGIPSASRSSFRYPTSEKRLSVETLTPLSEAASDSLIKS